MPMIEKGKAEGLQAYTEDLYEYRSDYADVEPNLSVGSLQSIRTDELKLIRNLSRGTEELYNMQADPGENQDLIEKMREREEIVELRRVLNSKLLDAKSMSYPFTDDEAQVIKERLRRLGYLV